MPEVLMSLRQMGYTLIPYVSEYTMWDVGSTELWLQTNNELSQRGWKC